MMRGLVLLAASTVALQELCAQGNLSTQGFGYPLGGLSTRALASGGASGEFDARSARNPAALFSGRSGLFVQYDPELRDVRSPVTRERTVTPRFAGFGAAFPLGERGAIGISSHSLLDRTWTTVVRSGQRLGADSVGFTETYGSSGAINELRLALAYDFADKVTVGAGLHLYSGENRLRLLRQFDDSLRYGTLNRDLTLAYAGSGVSFGVVLHPVQWITAAASARKGAGLSLRIVDTLRTEANVPDRYGAAVRLDALPGVSLVASVDHVAWSRMNGLGSATATARDADEVAFGAEFGTRGTRGVVPGSGVTYGVGYRIRDLPFRAAGASVSERAATAGVSIPFSAQRATIDLTVQRARRSAAGGISERAWLMSAGLAVRP